MSGELTGAAQAERATDRGASAGVLEVLGRWGVALALLTALGAALRFATLDAQSLFLDETVTADLLDRSLGGMLGALADSESAPPLYYALAWGWVQLWGIDEVALRSLSALLGTAMIPLAAAAAAKLTTQRVGLVTAALVAVNPLLVWYSQEARVYALFALLTTISLLAFAIALRDPTRGRIAWWGVASALAVAGHYFAAFLVVPQAVLLARAAPDRRPVYAATAGIAVVAAALIPLALDQRSVGTDWLTDNALVERVADTGVQFLVGPGVPAPFVIGPIAALLVLLGLWLLASRAGGDERRGARIGAIVGGAAIIAPLVVSLGVDVFLQKAMIGAWLPLAIVPAAGYGAVRAGRAGLVAGGALCAVGIAVVVAVASIPDLQRDDWRGAAESLGGSTQPRVLLVNPADAGPPHDQAIRYYLPEAEPASFETRTSEVDLLSHEDSGLDAQVRGAPELPNIPTPPGFQLVERVETERFTLLRYQAPERRSIAVWARAVRKELEAADRGPTKALAIPPGAG